MGLFDWFKKKKDKVDVQDLNDFDEDDDELDEELYKLGFGEPDMRSQKMYAFVHLALRDAVMLNHPELIEQLEASGKEKPVMPFLHFWSRAMMILESNGMLEMEDELDEDEWMPFDKIGIEQFTTNGYRISVVILPEPRFSPEA